MDRREQGRELRSAVIEAEGLGGERREGAADGGTCTQHLLDAGARRGGERAYGSRRDR